MIEAVSDTSAPNCTQRRLLLAEQLNHELEFTCFAQQLFAFTFFMACLGSFLINTTFTAVFHAYTQQCCEDQAQEYKLIFKQLQTCSLSVSPVRLTSQEETSWIACNLELHASDL